MAWVAALAISAPDLPSQHNFDLPTISHDDLVKAQKEDPAIDQIREMNETNITLKDERNKNVPRETQKLLHEWRKYI